MYSQTTTQPHVRPLPPPGAPLLHPHAVLEDAFEALLAGAFKPEEDTEDLRPTRAEDRRPLDETDADDDAETVMMSVSELVNPQRGRRPLTAPPPTDDVAEHSRTLPSSWRMDPPTVISAPRRAVGVDLTSTLSGPRPARHRLALEAAVLGAALLSVMILLF